MDIGCRFSNRLDDDVPPESAAASTSLGVMMPDGPVPFHYPAEDYREDLFKNPG
jgi:hypothetical protein